MFGLVEFYEHAAAVMLLFELGGKRLDRKIRSIGAKKPVNEGLTGINYLTILELLAKAFKTLCQFSN